MGIAAGVACGLFFGELAAPLGIVGEVRGNHLMVGIECVANKETKELLPDEVQIARRIAFYCRQKGLIIRPLHPVASCAISSRRQTAT